MYSDGPRSRRRNDAATVAFTGQTVETNVPPSDSKGRCGCRLPDPSGRGGLLVRLFSNVPSIDPCLIPLRLPPSITEKGFA
jgi:hypothetical protein